MSIFDQIRGDRVPLQMFGVPSDRQILSSASDAFGKYLPSELQNRFLVSSNLPNTGTGGAGAGLDSNGNQTPVAGDDRFITPSTGDSGTADTDFRHKMSARGIGAGLDGNGNQTPFSIAGSGAMPDMTASDATPLPWGVDGNGNQTVLSMGNLAAIPDMTASDIKPLPLGLDSNGNQTVLSAGNQGVAPLPTASTVVPLRLFLDNSGNETPVTAIRADGSGDEAVLIASSPPETSASASTGTARQISANDFGLLAARSTAYANGLLAGLLDSDALSVLV